MTPVRTSPRKEVAASKANLRRTGPVLKAGTKQVDGFERKPAPVLTLQRGMTGSAVTALQQKLVAGRFMSTSDFKSGPGVYGPRTEAAVLRLQESVGLPQTGVATAGTQAALSSGARWQPQPEPTLPISLNAVRARRSHTFADDVTQPIALPLGA